MYRFTPKLAKAKNMAADLSTKHSDSDFMTVPFQVTHDNYILVGGLGPYSVRNYALIRHRLVIPHAENATGPGRAVPVPWLCLGGNLYLSCPKLFNT